MTITVKSTSISEGQPVPKQHTGDGADTSPALSWSGEPQNTQELALIMDDPDAPSAQPWSHWVVYKIPAGLASLPEAVPPTATVAAAKGACQGKNSFGKLGYNGPAPPRGKPHHYHFTIYALDAKLDLKPGATREDLLKTMKGHILATGKLIGTYKR